VSRERISQLARAQRLAAEDPGGWGRHPGLGHTPVVEIDGVLLSLQGEQVGGSVKARVAAWWLDQARAAGRLRPEQPVVTASSGSLAVGLAVAARHLGQPLTVVMSAGTPSRWTEAAEALGAAVVLVPQVSGGPGRVTGHDLRAAQEHARQLAQERSGCWLDQLRDPGCLAAHLAWTGPELRDQLPGPPGAFVACVGSAATFVGVGTVLKEAFPGLVRVAVEPAAAAVLAGRRVSGDHALHGCGFGFRTPMWEEGCAERLAEIDDEEVGQAQAALASRGIATSGSGAGAFAVGLRLRAASGTVLALLPDGRREAGAGPELVEGRRERPPYGV
jgi:cysteine synthase A